MALASCDDCTANQMIDEFELYDFKAHRSTRLGLGRLTMLVGDNAAGKSSVIDALALMSAFNPRSMSTLARDWHPSDLLRRGSKGPIRLGAQGTAGESRWAAIVDQQIGTPEQGSEWIAKFSGHLGRENSDVAVIRGSGGYPLGTAGWEQIGLMLGRAGLYLLRADRVAAAAYSSDPEASVGLDGSNTAVVLAAMKLGDDEAFERIESAMRALIPSVERVRIRPATVQAPEGARTGHKIYFDFRGAHGVPAHGASHGTLIVLSLLTILHGAHRPNLILLDDFDHALHPRAQMELVRMIKSLLTLVAFADLQIVATTHSPYVLDELEPSQIHAFALRDDGTVATKPLSAHPEADKVKGTLTAGQLWSLDPEREWVLRE